MQTFEVPILATTRTIQRGIVTVVAKDRQDAITKALKDTCNVQYGDVVKHTADEFLLDSTEPVVDYPIKRLTEHNA